MEKQPQGTDEIMTHTNQTGARLQLLAQRQSPVIAFNDPNGIVVLDRRGRGIYQEVTRYDTLSDYIQAVPADTPTEYLQTVEASRVAVRAEADDENQYYQPSVALLGRVGLELALRFTVNGARFSSLQPLGNGLHGNERFLGVSPSIYDALRDAYQTLQHRYAAAPTTGEA